MPLAFTIGLVLIAIILLGIFNKEDYDKFE